MSETKLSGFEFGVPLGPEQERVLKTKLERLAERAPSDSSITLRFEKRKSCVKGRLTISSAAKEFHALKAAPEPIQTYLLLEADIDSQLALWKSARFRNEKVEWRYA